MKKILILGNGAREHVIAETLMRTSNGNVEIFTFGGAKNPGLVALSSKYELGKVTDVPSVVEFAKKIQPDAVFPGPEAPLAAGVADAMAEIGIPTIGPKQTGARLESSKSFARDLLQKYNIPGNPKFKVFQSSDGLASYLGDTLSGEFVVKADGLQGGKGVKVSGEHLMSVDEGVTYAEACLKADGRVVVEEKFVGEEFSLMSFTDGETVLDMIPVQDHKRAYNGDCGPNTGGMGSYSDANHLLPFLTQHDLDEAHAITEAVAKALVTETGTRFQGILYGGFIATKTGVGLIEYNVRFGDPEAMNALSLLQTNFLDISMAIASGELRGMSLSFEKKASVCKYLVPEGYPDKPVKNVKITIGDIPKTVHLHYASVDQREDGLYLGGSRAIALTGIGDSLSEAEQQVEQTIPQIQGPLFHRSDIGTPELIAKRVERMKKLRG